MQQFNDDFLKHWEGIIAEVNKTNIPVECIKKIIIKLAGKKQRTINLVTLRRQGLDWDEIETVINRTIIELGDQVITTEFVVDAVTVAEIVQPRTDELLTKLK